MANKSVQSLWGSVAGGGEEWIGEALVGCRCRYFLVSQILHGFVVTLLLLSNDLFPLANAGTRIR